MPSRRLLCSALLFPCFLFFLTASPRSAAAQSSDPPREWQRFEHLVRDGKVGTREGTALLESGSAGLQTAFPPEGYGSRIWFPLAGYGIDNVGGSNGEGYRPDGYRFLDGNAHTGHPAQDIFIFDANQDALDDTTGNHARVLALADGVVVSTFGGWANRNELRGGNYVWIYHPARRMLSYSAHLQDILVKVGDRVRGGQQIATLGRSGKNASLPRSPTHLHVMLLEVDGMGPVDPFPLLREGSKKFP